MAHKFCIFRHENPQYSYQHTHFSLWKFAYSGIEQAEANIKFFGVLMGHVFHM